MLTQKLIAQDVANEMMAALRAHDISELEFLRKIHCDHHLMAKLRGGDSVRTETIAKLYQGVIDYIDRDWAFGHELRDAIVMRAKAHRFIRGSQRDDGLSQAVFELGEWEKLLRRE